MTPAESATKPSNLVPAAAKVDWILAKIAEHRARGEQVVVFSSFVQFLKILQTKYLAGSSNAGGAGASSSRAAPASDKNSSKVFDGSLTVTERADTIKQFQANQLPVLFCSLKCAGVGITLTNAKAVIIADLHWNRATENQAVDRVHRIGAKHQAVDIYRLVAADTIEDRMLLMQEHKENISSRSVDHSLTKTQLLNNTLSGLILDLFDSDMVREGGGKKKSSPAPWMRRKQ